MIDDNVFALKMYCSSVPEESRDEEVINFLKVRYCVDMIEKDLSTLKYLERQFNNPVTDLFKNECLAGIKPSREDNAKKAYNIKLNNLLRYSRYLTNYLLEKKRMFDS